MAQSYYCLSLRYRTENQLSIFRTACAAAPQHNITVVNIICVLYTSLYFAIDYVALSRQQAGFTEFYDMWPSVLHNDVCCFGSTTGSLTFCSGYCKLDVLLGQFSKKTTQLEFQLGTIPYTECFMTSSRFLPNLVSCL
jgi:hypothetical protein